MMVSNGYNQRQGQLQWRPRHRWLLITIFVLSLTGVAAKGKKTNSPTQMPTIIPSKSPTSMPSVTAKPTSTAYPTGVPTPTPTVSVEPSISMTPTQDPTTAPVELPSSSPSNLPTGKPTVTPVPTIPPTASPTKGPTVMPSATPPPTPRFVWVTLPLMEFFFIMNDEQVTSPAFHNVTSEMTAFLQNLFATNSAIPDVIDVDFEYEIIQRDVPDRRRLSIGIEVEVQGAAQFDSNAGDIPTAEELEQILRAYFSFWGLQDLEEHLHAADLTTVRDTVVYLEGSKVKVVTDSEDDEEPKKKLPLGGKSSEGGLGKTKRAGIIAGLVIGTFVLLMAVLLLICQGARYRRHCKRRARQARHPKKYKQRYPESRNTKNAAPTRNQKGNAQWNRDEADVLSIDHSLYTTDESISPPPLRPGSDPTNYDAKRLDKIIAAAKQSSDEALA